MIAERISMLEEWKGRSAEELLQAVADSKQPMLVRFPGGEAVSLRPGKELKPLITLPGRMPEGWKDAIYEP